MTSVNQTRGRLGNLAALLAAMSYRQNEYRPKFCRTRGCSLKFEHDGSHEGAPTVKAGPAPLAEGRATMDSAPARSAQRRAARMLSKAEKHAKSNQNTRRSHTAPATFSTVRHVNANPRGYATREHMAAIRRGESPAPLPVPVSPGRRQEILARRAVTR